MKKAVIITKSCKICGLHFETKDTKRGRKKKLVRRLVHLD